MLNDDFSSNKQNAADLFASYCKSVYSCKVINDDVNDLMIQSFDIPNNIYLTVDDVFQSLSSFRGVKIVCPDSLSGVFL